LTTKDFLVLVLVHDLDCFLRRGSIGYFDFFLRRESIGVFFFDLL
jgi:hypothetical protein